MAKRLIKVLLGIAVVFGILWSGLWFGAQWLVAGALAKPDRTVSGMAAKCSQSSVSGFPLRFEIGCGGLSLNEPRRGLTVSVPNVTATALLFPPGRLMASVQGPVKLRAGESQITGEAGWANAAARVDVGLSGLSSFATVLETGRLVLDSAVGLLPVHVVEVRRGEIELRPSRDTANSLNLIAGLDALHIERPNGKTLPDVNATIDVTANELGSIGGIGLETWVREKGGRIQVGRIEVGTGGTSVRMSGELTLAPTGLLSGKLAVRFFGLSALPDLGEALIPGSGEFVGRVSAAFKQLTRPVATPEGPAQEIELSIRNGAVFFGIFPILYPEGGKLVPLAIPALRFG